MKNFTIITNALEAFEKQILSAQRFEAAHTAITNIEYSASLSEMPEEVRNAMHLVSVYCEQNMRVYRMNTYDIAMTVAKKIEVING